MKSHRGMDSGPDKSNDASAEALKEETADVLREDLRMELSLEKTRITPATEGFDFLGHHIVLKPNKVSGPVGVRIYPSKKSLRAVQEKVKKITSKQTTNGTLAEIIIQLNPVLEAGPITFGLTIPKRPSRTSGPTPGNECMGGCARSIAESP